MCSGACGWKITRSRRRSITPRSGLRTEARQQLERVHPRTVGQASRIPGVTPADIAILLVHVERMRHARRGA